MLTVLFPISLLFKNEQFADGVLLQFSCRSWSKGPVACFPSSFVVRLLVIRLLPFHSLIMVGTAHPTFNNRITNSRMTSYESRLCFPFTRTGEFKLQVHHFAYSRRLHVRGDVRAVKGDVRAERAYENSEGGRRPHACMEAFYAGIGR